MAAEENMSKSHVSPRTHDTALSTGRTAAETTATGLTSEAADSEAGGSVGIGIKPAHRCKRRISSQKVVKHLILFL
jgi:hypothetical protein